MAIRHKVRDWAEQIGESRVAWLPDRGFVDVISRTTGALLRAVLVVIVVATPSLILPHEGVDAKQAVALVALFLGALVFVEYASTYPGLVEFRHAPPFNRIRFLSLFATVFLLTVLVRGQQNPTEATLIVEHLGVAIGKAIDFPYSPVRLVTLALSEDASIAHVNLVRTAAGISYLISLLTLSLFVILLKIGNWPGQSGVFNVWINLPTFDPTAGGDVVDRLERDARVNIALGFLLPFLAPAALKAAAISVAPLTLDAPQMLIWTMAAWSFLPASLFMRGIAMGRIADLIRESRRAAASSAGLATA